LLGGYREIGNCTAAIAKERPANKNRGMVFSARSSEQQLKNDSGTVFLYNELVVIQSPYGKDMKKEAL
jgi:hypothetical protein